MAHNSVFRIADVTTPSWLARDILALRYRNATTRRALARLGPEALADIDLTEEGRRCEVSMPFWV